MSREIKWLDEPEPHDYTAALSVLSLPYSLEHAGRLVEALRAAPVEEWKAKDIIRMADEIIRLYERAQHMIWLARLAD